MARKLLEQPRRTTAGATMGRPRKQPPADVKEIIESAAAEGGSLASVAAALACDVSCLKRWMDEAPELKQAFDTGRERERKTLHNKLYETAVSGSGKDALIAAMFLLKSKHGYKEGEPTDSQNSRVQIEIKLPAALDAGKYAEVIEHE